LFFGIFHAIFSLMTITKTVDIPISRLINVPDEVPTGRTIIAFTPAMKAQTVSANRKPITEYFGILSPDTYGDSVAYQRNLRDEWDD